MTADATAGEVRRRLHWSSMLSALGKSLRAMWGMLAGGAFLAASGEWFWVALFVGGSIVATLVAAFIRWRTFSYTVGPDEIRIDSGIVARTHRSIPFDRIHDVDISQGPLARVLGVASAKFETGASGGVNPDEGMLAAVRLQEAEDLRHLVRGRRSGEASVRTAADAPAEAEPAPIYAMDTKRLLLSGLFNFSLALVAALIGASQTFGDAIGIDPFERSFWKQMGSRFGPFAAYVLAHRIAAAVGGVLLLALIGIVSGVTRTVLRDYRFRLDRTETGLRRRRGLLTKTDVTLQIRRVQAAVVGSGPVRARFGWSDLKLQSLAQDQGSKDDHLIAPLAMDGEIDGLLDELRFGQVSAVQGWRSVSPAFVTILAISLLPLLGLAAVQAVFEPIFGVAAIVALSLALLFRWLAWRRTRFVLEPGRVLVRTGWWRRRTSILPLRNVQTVELAESFISRWFGTATLTFGVAGGTGHNIPALPRNIARELRRELLSSVT